MNVVDCGSYCIVNINNQLYRYDYTGNYDANNITEQVIRNQGTTVSPGQVLQMGMVDENEFAELGFDSDDDGLGETTGSGTSPAKTDTVDYNNWLVNNGLSGISKLSAESKLEDVQAYYEQIANKLSSIMNSIDSALASKDPDTIDACMTELTYNMAALEGVSQQSGMGSIMSADVAWGGMWGGLAAAGVATMAGATGTLFTVAGVSATIPGIGWAVAAGCAIAGFGIAIYNNYKQGQIDDLKEQMQQTMDDCTAKYEYAQKEISETVDDVVSEITNSIEKLEQSEFSDISDMNDVFVNINGILNFQAAVEKWAGICEKYGVPFEGADILEKLGDSDNKNKYADEYIENFVEHTKNAIETSGNVVDDTGTYIASADEITALISMLFDSEMTRQVNTAPLSELIQFIQERNQEDVNSDAGAIGDGMHAGGTSYDFSGYSNAYNTAGDTQAGVNGAASDGQYDVDTTQYEEVQKEAQEAAQKDVDEYLDSIEISGKTVEELEELYETTNSDLEDFSQYKENLDLDLSRFDTVLSNIRQEQQARVDEYISSIEFGGKSMSELEKLYDEVSGQGEAFKKASSEVDTSAFDDVLSNIRSEQQSIVDKYADEVSSKLQSAGSMSELKRISAEMGQYIDTVSEYSVNTGKLSAINSVVDEKIQAMADEKATSYEIKAVTVNTSDDCIVLADIVNIEIAQFEGTNADTSGLQKVAADLVSKANILRVEEAKKKAEEDAMNVPATMPPAGTTESNNGAGTLGVNEGQTPVTIPSFADDGVAAYDPENPPVEGGEPPVADGDPPAADEEPPVADGDAADGKTPVENGENIVPPVVEGMEPSGGEPVEPSGETEMPVTQEPADAGNGQTEVEEPPASGAEDGQTPPVASEPSDGDNGAGKTEETQSPGSNGIISVGQADETTPPPKTDDIESEAGTTDAAGLENEVGQIIEEGLEEGKTPSEIADLIEIEVEE